MLINSSKTFSVHNSDWKGIFFVSNVNTEAPKLAEWNSFTLFVPFLGYRINYDRFTTTSQRSTTPLHFFM